MIVAGPDCRLYETLNTLDDPRRTIWLRDSKGNLVWRTKAKSVIGNEIRNPLDAKLDALNADDFEDQIALYGKWQTQNAR